MGYLTLKPSKKSMGILRLLLAISVVTAHSSDFFGFHFVGGKIAVQAFYIISGFYMTLILNEKYIGANSSYKLFLTNRLLRLLPIYWVVLLCSVIISLLFLVYTKGQYAFLLDPYFKYSDHMNLSTLLFLSIVNIIVLGQDIVMFLGLNTVDGSLFFTQNFLSATPPLFTFIPISQAWTVGLELTFYLIAPYIVIRRIPFVLVLFLGTLFVKVFLQVVGLNYDPWTYRFFPAELTFFLLGYFSYKIYKIFIVKNIEIHFMYFVLASLIGFTIFYKWIPVPFKEQIYLSGLFVSIPFIFILTKSWKLDNAIGELSYPIYISHLLIISLIRVLKFPLVVSLGVTSLGITLIFSVILNELIAKRVEKIRQKRIQPKVDNTFALNEAYIDSPK